VSCHGEEVASSGVLRQRERGPQRLVRRFHRHRLVAKEASSQPGRGRRSVQCQASLVQVAQPSVACLGCTPAWLCQAPQPLQRSRPWWPGKDSA